MRRRAEDLGDGGADGHLPVGPAEDELAALARTLNRFVDRQHENAARERRMVSDAAHELRTPLAALTARLELAHRHSGDAPALEGDLTAAERDAARLSALAASLLELSRLDDGADEHVTSTADELVSELMASVDRARALPEAVTTEVDFVTAVPDGDARYAIGRSAFARVVDNLTANALAAATGGSVQVDLAQRDDELVLRVLDDGPGVPDAFLPHAFERFARATRRGTAPWAAAVSGSRSSGAPPSAPAVRRRCATGRPAVPRPRCGCRGADQELRPAAVLRALEISNEVRVPFRGPCEVALRCCEGPEPPLDRSEPMIDTARPTTRRTPLDRPRPPNRCRRGRAPPCRHSSTPARGRPADRADLAVRSRGGHALARDPGSHTVAGIGGWLEAGGIVAGLIGTDLVLVMLVLAARVPVIDRLIGQDVAIAHHRALGKPVLYLLLAHGALLTLGYGIGDGTGPIAETVALFGSQDMPLAYLSIGLFVVVVGTSIVAVRRRLPYEAWHVIHLLSYAAVLVAFPHMTAGSVLGAGSWQRAYWIALYVAAFGLVALYRFVLPVVVTFRHRIRVVGVEPIAPGVVSIHMAGRDLDALGAHGGQYGVWRFWSRQTWWHAHPGSFSAVPSRNGARITVRDLGAGGPRGTPASARGRPSRSRGRTGSSRSRHGPRRSSRSCLGIGITPIRALLEDADLRPGEATVLLRGSDTDQQYLWEETAELAPSHRQPCVRHGRAACRSAESWMTEDDLRRGVHLRSVFPDLLDSTVRLRARRCGRTSSSLRPCAAGVPEHRIHQERFAS